MLLPQLKRIRWAVRLTLFLGVAASICANVLHAQQNPISQTISAWPPLALLLTVELTSRIPMHKKALAAVRVLATVVIAGIAAWVSYWHMQGVATKFGETEASAYLLPVSVDGLIVVASVSLVELAGRIRMIEERRMNTAASSVAPVQFIAPVPAVAVAVAPTAPTAPMAPVAPAAPAAPMFQPAAPAPTPTYVGASVAAELAQPVAHQTPVSQDGVATASPRVPTSPLSGRPLNGTAGGANAPVSPALVPSYANGTALPNRPGAARAAVSAPARTMVTAATSEGSAPRQRRPLLETADLADEIEAMRPEISPNELAKELGISPTRLRAVRREAREVRRSTSSRR